VSVYRTARKRSQSCGYPFGGFLLAKIFEIKFCFKLNAEDGVIVKNGRIRFFGDWWGDADCMWKIPFDADRDYGRLQLVRVSVRAIESTAEICSLRVCNQWPINEDRSTKVATHVSIVPKMDIYVPPLTVDILGLPAALVPGDHHTLSVMAAPGSLPNAFSDTRRVPGKNNFLIPNSLCRVEDVRRQL
jgi:hypothetical protein